VNPWIRSLAYRWLPARARLALLKAYYLHQVPRIALRDPESAMLAEFVAAGDCVLDVGANVGWYSVLLSRLVGPAGAVHAFEPVPVTAEILAHVVKGLHLTNVHVHRSALADCEAVRVMEIPRDPGGADDLYLAHLLPGPDPSRPGVRVAVTTLDSLRAAGLARVAFIKCDVEGAELLVLRGAARLLAADHPGILCEVCEHSERLGMRAQDVFSFLAGLDYRPYRVVDGRLVDCAAPMPDVQNYFFLPSARAAPRNSE